MIIHDFNDYLDLNYVLSIVSFDSPRKYQKTLVFSGAGQIKASGGNKMI